MTATFNQQLQSTKAFFSGISHIYDSLDPASRSIAKLVLFAQLVKGNAPYDLKVHGYSQRDIGTFSLYNGQIFRYDDYGNYNFGVAARAFGISLNMATFGAGMYQIKTGTQDWSNTKGWFDDPRDTQMIINGYNDTIK